MFPSPALATSFKSILSADLQVINELTENGTKIPRDPVLKEQVLKKLSDYETLERFLKGFGTGAINSVKDLKDSISGLLGSISNFDTQEEKDFMVSMANMIYQTDFKSLISNAPDIASKYYNDFLQASPEKKGEVIGYASSELLSMFLGAGLGKGALKALQGAGKLTKSGELVNGILSSAKRVGLGEGQLSKFVDDIKYILENQTGSFSINATNLLNVSGKATKPVANMKEFFKSDLGQKIKNNSLKTSNRVQGQSVFQVNEKILKFKEIRKGDFYYLDGKHKNHLEVFDKKGKIRRVLNLDGTVNIEKTSTAIKEGRRIDI